MDHYLTCDVCNKKLSTYLHGKGGAEELAHIGGLRQAGTPDLVTTLKK